MEDYLWYYGIFCEIPFKDSLAIENDLINNGWLAANDSISGLVERQLDVPQLLRVLIRH